MCRDKRREDCSIGDDVRRVRVETAKKVEHQLGLGDGVTNVAKGVGRVLHALGVLIDGQITLGHRVELLT